MAAHTNVHGIDLRKEEVLRSFTFRCDVKGHIIDQLKYTSFI